MTHDRTDPEQAIKAAPTLTRSQVETAQHYVEREDAVNVTLPKYIAAGLCSMALRCSELESRLREVEGALAEFVRIEDEDTHGLMAGSGVDVLLALESARRLLEKP